VDLWVAGMTHGSSALENGLSRDEKAKENSELRNWFAVLKNKEEMRTEAANDAMGKTV